MIGLTLVQKFDPLVGRVRGSVLITPLGKARELEESEIYKRVGNYLAHQNKNRGLLPNQLYYPIFFHEMDEEAVNQVQAKRNE